MRKMVVRTQYHHSERSKIFRFDIFFAVVNTSIVLADTMIVKQWIKTTETKKNKKKTSKQKKTTPHPSLQVS